MFAYTVNATCKACPPRHEHLKGHGNEMNFRISYPIIGSLGTFSFYLFVCFEVGEIIVLKNQLTPCFERLREVDRICSLSYPILFNQVNIPFCIVQLTYMVDVLPSTVVPSKGQ
jgi:hypothetical protein